MAQRHPAVTPARKRAGTKSQVEVAPKRVRYNDTWDEETVENRENNEPLSPAGLHLQMYTPVSISLSLILETDTDL
jgi:hypothetical protein